jgi:hypothetical protein
LGVPVESPDGVLAIGVVGTEPGVVTFVAERFRLTLDLTTLVAGDGATLTEALAGALLRKKKMTKF